MIPYASCMCFRAESSSGKKQRAWKLVSAQKGTSLSTDKDENFFIRFRDGNEASSSLLTDSELCMLEAVKRVDRCSLAFAEQEFRAAGRNTRQPVIIRVLDLNLLDDTYSGITKILLSKCNNWSFNTFNLDICTGGRSLSYLLVHLFQEYGFVKHFKLDIVKIWHCFNLMESAYHRHNPYHNSVHAADVTQAMHCFLQENKFAAHLTPLEAMSAVIAAVAHDLDHPGVTQAFLVATSNHLVNLYHNSSVLEHHHWRTAVSCLSESGIFNHLDKEVWLEIQRQIRSLILATDITRQKEFLARFKHYLNSDCLDMTQDQYRHFALQIALKCADLCNPCRPWAISQRWSYQVCQEFYRQGAYERQLKLPLTPTFDCSRTKVAKIQADFFQFVVSPLFETWDYFLKTPLSRKLLENLRHNYSQWQKKMEIMQQVSEEESQIRADSVPEIKIDSSASDDIQLTEENKSDKQLLPIEVDVVHKQHRSKSDSGLTPRLLSPKIHMETYSSEELNPSTTLLSLSSITNTVQLRKVYAATKVESHLICPTVFQPIFINSPTKEPSMQEMCSTPPQDCSDGECGRNSINEEEIVIDTSAQSSSVLSCPNGCGTPPLPNSDVTSNVYSKKQRSQSLIDTDAPKYSQVLNNRRASDVQTHNTTSYAHIDTKALSYKLLMFQTQNNDGKQLPSFCKENSDSFPNDLIQQLKSSDNVLNSTNCSNKLCLATSCTCENEESSKNPPSWCWHITRSISAERPIKPSHEFDAPLQSWQGSTSSLSFNAHPGRRSSAPVTVITTNDCCDKHSTDLGVTDLKVGAKDSSNGNEASGRRWSIPIETVSGLQIPHGMSNADDDIRLPASNTRRSSLGILEPLLAMSKFDSENSLLQSSSPLKSIHQNTLFVGRNSNEESNEKCDSKSPTNSDSFLPSFAPSQQSCVQRRGSLPTEVPIALMCHVVSPSHLRNKITDEQYSSTKETSKNNSNRSRYLLEQARKHGSPGDILNILIGPSGMLNTMHGIVSGQTICKHQRTVAQENIRRKSGGLELLSGLWRSRTSDVAIGMSMASKLKLRRQLLDEWSSWRTEENNVVPTVNPSSSISTVGQQFIYQHRRGSVPLNVSLLSLSSENTFSGDPAD